MNRRAARALVSWSILLLTHAFVWAQGVEPYPNAITDRLIRTETPMPPPPVNSVFQDPDFGSQMVRVTDENTRWWHPGSFFRTPSVGTNNSWSADSNKFYTMGQGGIDLAFGFNPSTMEISSLPGAPPGRGLLLPLRPEPTFSLADPDVIYGTTYATPLTISRYRFSTNTTSPLIDTTTCGVQPPLDPTNPSVRSNEDISGSADDQRVAISEGGKVVGKHMFVVVYDKKLGCRWYNTQTGQIGGSWGASGYASVSDRFLVSHARISGDGSYVKIRTNVDFYFWDLATLEVTPCPTHSKLHCSGYGTVGRSSYINGIGIDAMNIARRPLNNLSDMMPLIWPLPSPHAWEQEQHFSWLNGDLNDNAPVCGSVYSYDGDTEITRAWDDEIVCLETDGIASTVWRFAHHRAYMKMPYFNTQPLGNVSPDGRFFMFTSSWDGQLGTETNGTPRSDVFIVRLN